MQLFWKAKLFLIIHFVSLQLVPLIFASIKNILNPKVFSSLCQGHAILSFYAYFSKLSESKFPRANWNPVCWRSIS